MLSATRIISALAIALCAGCSAESADLDASGTPQSTTSAPAGAPGSAATGASGRNGGASGTLAAAPSSPAGAGTRATTPAASTTNAAPATTGDVNPDSGSAGAMASVSAGSGAQSAAAGSGGMSGSAVATAGAAGAPAGATDASADCAVKPITDDMRDTYENMNNPYYTKFADANGVIVGTGKNVGDEAITRYCRLLIEFTSNPKVREAIIADNMWFTMISKDEQLSSLPQINRDYGMSLNQRARGLGGLTPTICAEDSIMCLPGDRWRGDCICPHETGHTLYSSGIARVAELSKRLTEITDQTRSSGRISGSYVWMDGDESGMMAWGVQAWYDCAIDGQMGGYHPDINTREELKSELPDFYEFLSEILPQDNQYEDCYANP